MVVMLEQALPDIQSLGHLLLSLSLCATFTPQMEKVGEGGGGRRVKERGGGHQIGYSSSLGVQLLFQSAKILQVAIMSVLYDS